MERGLLWLPLLAIFLWLAWAGWNEFRKVEAYQGWAQGFERSKYDILAMMGIAGNRLVWGQPTRRGPINLHQMDLEEVTELQLYVNGQPADPQDLPNSSKRCSLRFLRSTEPAVEIPFTDLAIAQEWYVYLQERLQSSTSAAS